MKLLYNILKKSQEDLMTALIEKFPDSVYQDNEYLLVPGDVPIMLIAHLDTVHKEPVKDICSSKGGDILMSPQGIGGDDRCGVYALLKLAECGPTHHPWLLFCCDEEVGGLGSRAFAMDYKAGLLPKELSKMKMLIELDRKGNNDAVYYHCANDDLENYMTFLRWKTEFGTFTDICNIAPVLGVAAVNLSIGYYNQHTNGEYICISDMNSTIERVKQIILNINTLPVYGYVEAYRYKDYLTNWKYFDYTYKKSGKHLLY